MKSNGWRDIGYNFAVDKCGNIYEGRAGGVTKAVMGAHTLGFNTNSMGIAVLGTFSKSNPPAAAVTAIAKLTAWKLGLFGANPAAGRSLSRVAEIASRREKGQTQRHLRSSGRLRNRMPGNPSLQEARHSPDQLRPSARPLTARADSGGERRTALLGADRG